MLVTCAIILIDQKILAVQRSAKMKMPLKWEFPGGKIEVGESEEDCIHRELREELGIEVEILQRLKTNVHEYPDFKIELIPFVVRHLSGEIQLTEHDQYQLLTADKLLTLDWAEADIGVVEEFLVYFKEL